ncbi:MAG: hypothetical protein IPK64_21625 [bacterium]|nr:hypothetical protein [bacterium]
MNARSLPPDPRRAAEAAATRDPRPRRAAPKPRWPAPKARWRRRPDPRRSACRRLLAQGDVLIKSRGGRLVARAPRCPPVAFWPATGRWAARGGPTRRGLRKLLDFLHHNR